MACKHAPAFSVAQILTARRRLKGRIVETPLLSHPALDRAVGGRLLVKAECLQFAGSFKLRGALNALLALLEDDAQPAPKGVVTWSSGNHAQAVAWAAQQANLPAIIVMPADAPQAKIAGTKRLGGTVILYDRIKESREAIGQAIADDKGYAIIPPYDHLDVMAGQGTIGLEVADQVSAMGLIIDQVITPVSGGGLLSGVATAVQSVFPKAVALAAEPEGYADLQRTLVSGQIESNAGGGPGSLCDALMAPQVGTNPYPVLKKRITESIAISDAQAIEAMAWGFHALRVVIEPGGAAALAAALGPHVVTEGKTTVVVASGGNVDPDVFQQALARSPLPPVERL